MRRLLLFKSILLSILCTAACPTSAHGQVRCVEVFNFKNFTGSFKIQTVAPRVAIQTMINLMGSLTSGVPFESQKVGQFLPSLKIDYSTQDYSKPAVLNDLSTRTEQLVASVREFFENPLTEPAVKADILGGLTQFIQLNSESFSSNCPISIGLSKLILSPTLDPHGDLLNVLTKYRQQIEQAGIVGRIFLP